MSSDIHKERERKDAEMLRQRERAADSNDPLHGYDKTDADSFPASDPPSPAPAESGTEEQ
jgi:hypothetical protein